MAVMAANPTSTPLCIISVFFVNLEFIWIGKTKNSDIAGLEEKYLRRIGYFSPLEAVSIGERKGRDKHQQRRAAEQEAKLVEKRLGSGKFLVVLDEQGEQLSSLELAGWLKGWKEQGVASVAFVVGGHAGVPTRIKRQAHRTLSLSRMTLTHEMARVVLLEQLYRAFMILKGSPYHRSAHSMEVQ